MGRSEDKAEERRAKDRERKRREYWAEKTEKPSGSPLSEAQLLSKRAKARAAYRRRYAKNRAKENARRTEYARKNREAHNAKARRLYQSDPNGAAKQCARRHNREPGRIIRSAFRDYENGILGIDEYLERINEAIAIAERIANEAR